MAGPSSSWSAPPDAAEWASMAAERRHNPGEQAWLDSLADRLKDKWTSAMGPPPPGVETQPGRGKSQSSRATSRDADEGEADAAGQWAYRAVPDARRWVQALDTHPSFGDSRFLWYVLGRPVMVRAPVIHNGGAAIRRLH
jgi:hypothetical protein